MQFNQRPVMLLCLVSILLFPAVAQEAVTQGEEFTFYAVYDRLVDTDGQNIRIGTMAMSDDGTTLVIGGADAGTGDPLLLVMRPDEAEIVTVPLPDLEGRGIAEIAISEDGSQAFFTTERIIFGVRDTTVTRLVDSTNPEMNQFAHIHSASDGSRVYFQNIEGYSGDLWAVGNGGAGLTKIIEDTDVPRIDSDGGQGNLVDDFAISDDGSTIAFVLWGYSDREDVNIRIIKPELFVLDGDGYRQITNDAERVDKTRLAISGDGAVIVFDRVGEPSMWHSIRSNGTALTPLENSLFNFGGVDLTDDGALMVYSDAAAHGGRLVFTNGTGRLDLMPGDPIPLAATNSISMTGDGNRTAFVYRYSTGPSKEALYIGYLTDQAAIADAPNISAVTFDPPVMPGGDPDARINVTAAISDPQGLQDIARTSTQGLVDGYLGDFRTLPVYFVEAVHDDGRSPDLMAADGLFTAYGQPGDEIDTIDRMTARIAAEDTNATVVVADRVLNISAGSA